MELQYGKFYRELYQKHWWWRAREEALVRFLQQNLQADPQRNILDIGCGDGLFFEQLGKFGDVEGVEPDERLIDKDGPHASRIRIAPFDDRFASGKKYGLLVMLDVLEHLEDPASALGCAHGLLDENGALLMTVPAFQTLWTNHDVINHHRLRYRRETLFPLLDAAGFNVKNSQYWFQWTVPAKFMIGRMQHLLRNKPHLPKIPAKWLNRILFEFSSLELRTLGTAGLPIGSTLMVYCVKRATTAR